LVLLELIGYSTHWETQFFQFIGRYSNIEQKDISLNIYTSNPTC